MNRFGSLRAKWKDVFANNFDPTCLNFDLLRNRASYHKARGSFAVFQLRMFVKADIDPNDPSFSDFTVLD